MRSTLLLAYDFPPAGGGIARVMSEIARRYPTGTLTVSTGTPDGGEGDDADIDARYPNPVDRVEVERRDLKDVPGLLIWSRRAAALARSKHAGFVWGGQIKPAGYAAEWVRERVGVPYGLLVYGGDLLALQHDIHRSALRRRTATRLLGSASAIVAVSDWTRDLCMALLAELGLDPDECSVRVVPLGSDPTTFKPGVDTAEIRKRYHLGQGRWLLTVGRLLPHKGVDSVLQAVAELCARVPDIHYAVAGSGPSRAELGRQAESLGIADRVHFLGDVPDADLPALYNVADIYVSGSRRDGASVEGFGIAVAEASATALPVIAGRSGGIPEAMRDGETGILVEPERPSEIAAAVMKLVRSPALARRLGEAARVSVERRYNWDRVVSELREIAGEFALT